jgi:hypothetical protein
MRVRESAITLIQALPPLARDPARRPPASACVVHRSERPPVQSFAGSISAFRTVPPQPESRATACPTCHRSRSDDAASTPSATARTAPEDHATLPRSDTGTRSRPGARVGWTPEWGDATLGNSGATWHDLAGDQQTRRGAAPARPHAAAPRSRPDRPGVRAAAGRRGARPRRAHVGRAPQPPVPARLRRVAVRLPHDAAHRARDGAAASWRPQRHRGLFRGRLLVAGHLQHSLHRRRAPHHRRDDGQGGPTPASTWPPPTSTAPSSGCRPATPRSSRSRPSSRTGFATAPSAIPPA